MSCNRVPVEKGLFSIPSHFEEKPLLLASKCENCGEISFPATDTCSNCGKAKLLTINLSQRGKTVKSTVVRRRPPLYEGPVPFVVAEVELPEGINIPTVIKGWDKDEPPPYGLEVELALDKLEIDEQGNEVMMYIFKPVLG